MEKQTSTGKIKMKKTSFEWVIEDFPDIEKNIGEALESPLFNSNNLKWQVLLYPKGENKSCKDYLSLTVKLMDCKDSFSTNLKVSIINDENEKCYSRIGGITEFSDTNQSCSFDKFIERKKLMSRYLSDDNLTLMCEFYPDLFDTSIESASSVSNLFNDEKSSDVTFIVGDEDSGGEYMYAHSIILKKKSDVFAKLIEENLGRKGKSKIVIDDEADFVFIEMLRYLYTGKVDDMEEVAHTLLGMTIKYKLDDLTDICIHFLSANVSEHDAIICLLLSDSYKIPLLRRSCINYIASNAKVVTEMYDFKSVMKLDKDILLELIRAMALKIG